MSDHLRIFHQRWEDLAGSELAIVRGRAMNRVPESGQVRERPSIAELVRNAVGRLLRWAGLTLLIAPALIVPKLFVSRELSDILSVGFVVAVVTFFALLALYFLVSLPWWGLRNRPRAIRFAKLRPSEAEQRAKLAGDVGGTAGTIVRVTGRVVPLGPSEIVLRAFAAETDIPWRLVEASDFAVVPREGIAVIARMLSAPVLGLEGRAGSYDELAGHFSARARELIADASARGRYVEVSAGDRVEIVGAIDRSIANAADFELDGEACRLPRLSGEADDPYRKGTTVVALVLGSETAPRIVLRSVQ